MSYVSYLGSNESVNERGRISYCNLLAITTIPVCLAQAPARESENALQ